MTPQLVVGIRSDDSASRDAVALGADLARLWGADVVLTGAWASPLGAGDTLYSGVVRKEIERELRVLRQAVPEDVYVTTEVRGSTSISRALHRASEAHHAEMLVLGPVHGKVTAPDAAAHNLLTVVHDAPSAVAVAPKGYRNHPRSDVSVMAAWDGSEESRLALETSVSLALAMEGSLRLVHVVETPLVALSRGLSGDPRFSDWMKTQVARGREILEAGVAAVAERVPVRAELAEGLPEVELARAARDDRFAVVGSRGYGSVRRSVLGSTSAGLLELARIPVIVCPRTTQVPHTVADPATELASV
jgi:nucleotide-binding universal stress UspA family protein